MAELILPNNWYPRDYQLPAWQHLRHGGKRALLVWHRRSGKDDLCLHYSSCAAHDRVGTYWHMLPEAAQARKTIWDAINEETGQRRIDEAFPLVMRESTQNHEMFIRFRSGSTWQVVGSDNYNSLVGASPVGVVFSEWALAKPQAWAYINPILERNGGWAFFVTTSRGKNHAFNMYEGFKDDPDWYVEKLTAEQTPVFTPDQLEKIKRNLIKTYGESEGIALYEQEYLCSFEGAVPGAIYAAEIREARAEGRITKVPYDRSSKVHTWWDIGIGDNNFIWFGQKIGREARMIDCYECSGIGADKIAKVLQDKPYLYGEMWLPHDGGNRSPQTGKSYKDFMADLMPNVQWKVVQQWGKEESITQTRLMFPTVLFDEEKTKPGLDCLLNYRWDYSDKLSEHTKIPVHDWASHGADAFATFACSFEDIAGPRVFSKIKRPYRHIV